MKGHRPPIFWGRRELEIDVLEEARARVAHAFDLFENIVVSFSGGKDSTVVLNLALEEAARRGTGPVRAVFCDEEAIPYETEAYVRRMSEREDVALEWYCLPVRHRNACARKGPGVWWPWAPEDVERWCRPLPPEAITELDGFPSGPPEARPSWPSVDPLLCPPRRGTAGMLMGIRADESMIRRKAVSARETDNYIIQKYAPPPGGVTRSGRRVSGETRPTNVYKVYPIYDWRTPDVWAAPARLGWDYNEAYDVMEMAGIPHHAQRCAPPFGEEPMQKLWTFKVCFPDVWAGMSARVPGAATAARYASTELYSFGSVSERPEGVTWEEHVRARLMEHAPEARSRIASRIRMWMLQHQEKTDEPILDVPHPESGVSWPFLYTLADRGDLKERRWAAYAGRSDEARYAKVRAVYDEALTAHRAEEQRVPNPA